jgi:hypothetical protein
VLKNVKWADSWQEAIPKNARALASYPLKYRIMRLPTSRFPFYSSQFQSPALSEWLHFIYSSVSTSRWCFVPMNSHPTHNSTRASCLTIFIASRLLETRASPWWC